ncbi:MAG: hypothetical protein F6K36_28180 [Symploca sp. SIO3C6]|uniref:Uncharacterized protein n=1 Tax=Symploca sp. SIO1C4 TaxID=2607765 RepID=A0A6B3MYZ1_9CYAN|nr:hypothetical protein [Symploca sp. SIO3C6]NER26656.1 hypothetical protein [Symploca sp. SIO1C4]
MLKLRLLLFPFRRRGLGFYPQKAKLKGNALPLLPWSPGAFQGKSLGSKIQTPYARACLYSGACYYNRDFIYHKNEIIVTPAGVESGWRSLCNSFCLST